MARKRTCNDTDHQDGSQGSSKQRKRPKKQAPEPKPLPEFEPMHIKPMADRPRPNLPPDIDPSKPYDIFRLFFTQERLEIIARHTNEYAALSRQQLQLKPYTRPWKDTTPRELLAYFGIYIYMGLNPLHDVAAYWNTNRRRGVHDAVREAMGLKRWQQLDRYLHISKPGQKPLGKESPFDKVEPLNEELRNDMMRFWTPTTHLAIDEAIQRFLGRAKETVNIPSKPTPEGFKIWVLANCGYILAWLFHARGTGPVLLDDYWTRYRGFPPTQAVVFELLLQEGIQQDCRHIVWLDNLFTSVRLFALLRDSGFGAAGTMRTTKSRSTWLVDTSVDEAPAERMKELLDDIQTQQIQQTQQTQVSQSSSRQSLKEVNRGLDSSLAELKTVYEGQVTWNELYGAVSPDGKVLQFAWKDQRIVLFMTTVTRCSGGQVDMVKRVRKRPSETSSNARTSRAPFGDAVVKELEIPEFINLYNHNMGPVDQADQLRVYYNTQRVHCKSWKALLHWLLDMAVVNAYKLSSYKNQYKFREDLAEGLFQNSERLTTPHYDRTIHMADIVSLAEDSDHTRYEQGKEAYCKACEAAGRTVTRGRANRKPLQELSTNSTLLQPPSALAEPTTTTKMTRFDMTVIKPYHTMKREAQKSSRQWANEALK